MLKLIKLRYQLNQEYFFSSSVLLKDLSETHKKIFFGCYSFLKAIWLICVFFFIEIFIIKNQAKSYLFDIGQLLFFFVCVFYFATISEVENDKTRIKDFLLGANFNHNEKRMNKKKLALVFFGEASALCFLMWLVLSPLIRHVAPINLLIACMLSIVNLLSIFFMNNYAKTQSGSKYWLIQYALVGAISFGIVQFWRYFKQSISFTTHEINRMMIFLMLSGFIYQIISMLRRLKKVNLQNQQLGGVFGDFIEKYLNHSAVIYAMPVVFLNIVSVSQLAKILIIVAYLSLFVMPNVMSLRFLNYYKLVGDSSNILVTYGQIILLFQLVLALISGILCGVNGMNLLLMSALLIGVMTFRIWLAILLARSKYEDGQKTDYYAISMFVPVMLLAAMAFFWR